MYVKLSITLATELTMHRYGCKDEDMGRGAGVRGGRERRKQVKTSFYGLCGWAVEQGRQRRCV